MEKDKNGQNSSVHRRQYIYVEEERVYVEDQVCLRLAKSCWKLSRMKTLEFRAYHRPIADISKLLEKVSLLSSLETSLRKIFEIKMCTAKQLGRSCDALRLILSRTSAGFLRSCGRDQRF